MSSRSWNCILFFFVIGLALLLIRICHAGHGFVLMIIQQPLFLPLLQFSKEKSPCWIHWAVFYRFTIVFRWKNTIDSDLELGKNHFILLSKPCDLLKKLSKNSIRFDVLTSLIKKHYEENSPTFSIEEQHSSEIWFKMWNFSISLRRRKETKWMVKVKVPWT